MRAPRIPTNAIPKGAQTRIAAIECLSSVEDGAFVQPALMALDLNSLPPNDQRLLREIVMGVLRHQLWLDNQISPHVKGGVSRLDHGIVLALRVGVFQLTYLDRVPSHAAVSTTVEAYKRIYGRKAAGLVNGVLRSILRTPTAEPEPLNSTPALARRYSQPIWLLKKWLAVLGLEGTIKLCETLNSPAPLIIRPAVHQNRDWLSAVLIEEDAEVVAGRWTAYALKLNHPGPFTSKSFKDGLWLAQDEASQLVCELLDPQPNDEIWDVCAAPGGKTALIQWLTQDKANCLATDISERKVGKMKSQFGSQSVSFGVHDGTQSLDNRMFDRIVLDAPCSAVGVIRRHPEIKWRRTPQDIEENVARQHDLLCNVAAHVKPGGYLVYSVCSSLPEEGTLQIEQFLKTHPDYCLAPPETERGKWSTLWQENGIQLWPHLHDTDAFFLTRLRRKA